MKKPLLLAGLAAFAATTGLAGAGMAPDGDVAAGEQRYKVNCVNCHGRTGRGMASFPSISGQDAAYVSDRLMAYRAREMVGPNSALMFSLAGELSDQDIADLAAFISTAFP